VRRLSFALSLVVVDLNNGTHISLITNNNHYVYTQALLHTVLAVLYETFAARLCNTSALFSSHSKIADNSIQCDIALTYCLYVQCYRQYMTTVSKDQTGLVWDLTPKTSSVDKSSSSSTDSYSSYSPLLMLVGHTDAIGAACMSRKAGPYR
jgi:hypothetical protein